MSSLQSKDSNFAKVSLRPHQNAAYAALQTADRGIIKMFCGTGKTRVIYRLLVDSKVGLFVVVFPRIALVEQFKRDYLEKPEWAHHVADIATIYICSKSEVGHTQFTTDEDTIEQFLSSDMPNKLVCITYQSLQLLFDAMGLTETTIDIAVFDEAHHCTAPATYDLLSGMDANRAYFFTATPDETMENDEFFGPILFTYTHREAVEDEICNDFEIVCRFALPDETNIYQHMAAAYQKCQNGRILVFHSFAEATVEGRTSVVQYSGAAAKRQCTEAFKSLGVVPQLSTVIAKTPNKQAILSEFESTADDAVCILHNCSILGEGIDTKAANAIVFADPKASTTAIIQNIGRATRRPDRVQRPASVIIPVTVDISKFQGLTTAEERHRVLYDEFTKGGFQAIQNVLAALRQEDEELMDAILRSPTRYTRSEVERTFTKAGYKSAGNATTLGELFGLAADASETDVAAALGRPLEIHSQNMDTPIRTVGNGANPLKIMHADDAWVKMEGSDAAVKAPRRPLKIRCDISEKLGIKWDNVGPVEIGAAIIDCTLGRDNWEERRQEWIAMFEKLGWAPSHGSKDEDEQCVGSWQHVQRRNFKINKLSKERIDMLNSTPGWKWEAEDRWELSRQNWIIWMQNNDYDKLKSNQAKAWQQWQRADFKNKKERLTQERIDILNDTKDWKWVSDNTWESYYKKWVASYQMLGHKPSCKTNEGRWQSKQRKLYVNNELSIERLKTLENTQGWTWEEEDAWELQRQHWIKMYSSLKRVPKTTSLDEDEVRAAQWQVSQRCAYHSKEKRMTDERINLLNQTVGWIWGEEDSWPERLKEWQEVVKEIKGLPSHTSKNIVEKRAGQWQHQQRTKYKNKKLPQNYIDILNSTSDWKWDDKDRWEVSRQQWIGQFNLLKRLPKQTAQNKEEKKAAIWQADQRKYFVKQIANRMTQQRIDILNATPGWKWSDRDDATTVSPTETPQNEIVHKKPRKFKAPTASQSAETGRQQTLSAIGAYHKRFHSLNSGTYYDEIRTDPQTFKDYHAIAERLDASDPPEHQVMTRLAAECAKLPPKCRIVDLGCGMNRLRGLASHLNWTSVDAVAADETVQVADLAALPYDDCYFQAAVLSRALWGRDHNKQLQEAFRVLNYGAPLIVCESRRRWLNEGGTNTLLEDLKSAGFHIKVPPADNDNVFQYIIAQKPALI